VIPNKEAARMSLPLSPSSTQQQVEDFMAGDLERRNPNVEVDNQSTKKEIASEVRFTFFLVSI